ncbi:hypothetical protein VB716_01850 [Synechococcus sp. CCY9201]|uniref:hypothetical protein n=1 Tax=Synechococcus sp. CCY9201 TaxID=174697 RepID=UPI002B1EBCD6|nr:hypothetical protein [Synechococcus sp. CCY9201]MEA5472965.1 hypothetical protein [Synechococcus sp. CCY9201]
MENKSTVLSNCHAHMTRLRSERQVVGDKITTLDVQVSSQPVGYAPSQKADLAALLDEKLIISEFITELQGVIDLVKADIHRTHSNDIPSLSLGIWHKRIGLIGAVSEVNKVFSESRGNDTWIVPLVKCT